MEVDNFVQIIDLLKFESDDDYYFLQIIKRRKDNPKMKVDHQVIKEYSITSLNYLDKKKEEIITLCEIFNARAYINLTSSSKKEIAFGMLKELVTRVEEERFGNLMGLYSSITNKQYHRSKYWIIDIDLPNTVTKHLSSALEDSLNALSICRPYIKNKSVVILSSVNGYHIITPPFDTQEFNTLLSEKLKNSKDKYKVEILRNSPTLLYFSPNQED